jgi:hypothetical protein
LKDRVPAVRWVVIVMLTSHQFEQS